MRRFVIAAVGVAAGFAVARKLRKDGFELGDLLHRYRARHALRLAREVSARLGMSDPERVYNDAVAECHGQLNDIPVQLWIIDLAGELHCDLVVHIHCPALGDQHVSLQPRPAAGADATIANVTTADHAGFDAHHAVFFTSNGPQALPQIPHALLELVAEHPTLSMFGDHLHLGRRSVSSVDDVVELWRATEQIVVRALREQLISF